MPWVPVHRGNERLKNSLYEGTHTTNFVGFFHGKWYWQNSVLWICARGSRKSFFIWGVSHTRDDAGFSSMTNTSFCSAIRIRSTTISRSWFPSVTSLRSFPVRPGRPQSSSPLSPLTGPGPCLSFRLARLQLWHGRSKDTEEYHLDLSNFLKFAITFGSRKSAAFP